MQSSRFVDHPFGGFAQREYLLSCLSPGQALDQLHSMPGLID